MTYPLVDIVIPAYRPRFFRQALKSALGQTYDFCRIFVSDNCPSDEIYKIVKESFAKNIVYARQEKLGVDNYLSAFDMASGDLIKPLFDDDILHPFCVERFVRKYNLVNLGGDNFFAFSSSGVINTENFMYRVRRPFKESLTIRGRSVTDFCIGEMHNFIGEFTTVIFSRNLHESVKKKSSNPFYWGGVDGKTGLPDVCYYLNAATTCDFFYIDEVLSYFRRSDDHISDSNVERCGHPNIYRIYTNWFDLYTGYIKSVPGAVINLNGPNRMLKATEEKFASNSFVMEKCGAFRDFLSIR